MFFTKLDVEHPTMYVPTALRLALLSCNETAESAWNTNAFKIGATGTVTITHFWQLGYNPLHYSREKYSSHVQSSMVSH